MTTSARTELARAALRDGRTVELPVATFSMWPLVRAGDRLTVAPSTAAALRPDDIAVVDRAGALVAHRVLSLAPLTLRGDACPRADAPDALSAVVGRVVAVQRGPFSLPLTTRLGRTLARLSRHLGRFAPT